MINRSTLLQEEEDRMIEAKTQAWNDRFAAESDAYPPTFDHLQKKVSTMTDGTE